MSVDAAECEAALSAGCGVGPDTPNRCSSDLGTCFPSADGDGFDCTCEDGTGVVSSTPTCESALFEACAVSCNDESGRCDPASDAVGFDCTCMDGASTAWRGDWPCSGVLSTCRPRCEATRGHCLLRPEGYDCACADGSGMAVDLEASDGVCLLAVELACGAPPVGESCQEVEDFGRTFSCSADGEGGWDCQCPAPMEEQDPGGDADQPADQPGGASNTVVPGPANADDKLHEGRPLQCEAALFRDC